MTKLKHKINWINTIFLITTPIAAIVGTALLCIFSHIHTATWILAGVITIITGLSITAGYHRLMSHRAYKAAWPVRLFFLLFGAAAFEGSALEWSTDHRNHHRYEDTEKDPYNINEGFWHAHIGWLVTLDPARRDYSNVSDLSADPMIRLQHRFFIVLGILFGFVLPMGIAALWGDALGGLFVAGALRMVFNHHATFAINSVCHKFGKRNYSTTKTAVDNWFTALFTFGEGYHSFHHQFPVDYRNGVRAYHFDPSKWLIRLMSWCGLATDLKTVSDHRILRQQVEVKEKLLDQMTQEHKTNTLDQATDGAITDYWWQRAQILRQKGEDLLKKIEHLEADYIALVRKKAADVYAKGKPCPTELKAYRKHLRRSCAELKSYLSLWHELNRQSHKRLLTTA